MLLITLSQAHSLPADLLRLREVVHVDVTDDQLLHHSDYNLATDPKKWKSTKTGRGPLAPGWHMSTTAPVMCAYKLVTIEFKWWGLQTRIEKYTAAVGQTANYSHRLPLQVYPRLFAKFHRELICWLDKWIELNMDDIRALEARVKNELDEQRKRGALRGMKPE